MKSIYRLTVIGILLLATCMNVFGQQLDQSTQRYLDVLMRRPANAYLFDRFYNEWLKHSGVEELEAFLKARADKGDAAYVTLAAMFYEKEGRDDDAMTYLTEAIKKSSSPADLLVMRANINIFNNNSQAAIEDLETAMADKTLSDEKRMEIQKAMGRAYVAAGSPEKAAEVWKKLLAGSADTASREEIMELMISEGLTDQALELCGTLIKSTDDNYRKVMLQLRQAEIYDRMGLNPKTLEAYDAALAGVETGSWLEKDILGRIAKIYNNESNAEGLLGYYDKLLNTRKKDLLVMRYRAEVIYQIEGDEKGIAAYRKILDVTPGNREIREQFGRFLVSCGETTEAIKVYEELAAQSPKDAQVWLDLAKLYRKADRTDDVVTAMKKYLACSDGSESAYMRTAKLLDYCGLEKQSCDVLREMLKKYPDSIAGREALADSLHIAKNDKEAIAILKALSATADAEVVRMVADKLVEWKMAKQAMEILTANEKRFPKNSAYCSSLGRTAMLLKKPQDALAYFRQQLELAEGFDEISQVTSELIAAAKAAEKENELLGSLKEKYANTPDKFTPADAKVLCELYMASDAAKAADSLLGEMLKKNPDSVLLWTQAYQSANRRDDYAGSMAALKRLLALESRKSGGIFRMMVDLALRNDQRQQALGYIRDWKRVSAGTSEAWLAEARVYYETQDTDKAIDVLRDAARKFPDDNNAQEMLVNYYTQAGKYADARRCLWRIFEQAGDMTAKLAVVLRLADNAVQSGTQDALIRDFESRAKTDPRSVFPHLAMSKIYERFGDYQRRRDSLYRAFELSSDNIGLLQEIARLEMQEGDYSRAIDTLKKAVTLDKTPQSRNLLIDTYLAAGEDEKGYAMLMEQMGEKVGDPKQGLAMLDKLVQADQLEQAANLGEKFVSQFPDDPGLKYYWGQVLRLADKPEKASDIFIALLDCKIKPLPVANPTNPSNPQPMALARRVNPYELMLKSMPEGYQDLQQVSYLDGRINIIRNSSGYYGGPYYPGMYPGSPTTGGVYVPLTTQQMVQQAWNNLRGIYNVLDESGQQALVRKISAAGKKYAKVYLTLNMRDGRNMQKMDELCAEFPDFDALQFQRWLWRLQNGVTPKDFAEFDKAIGKKYPFTEFMVLFNYNRPSTPEMYDVMIAKIKEFREMIKKNPELSAMGVNLSYSMMNMFLTGKLSDEQKKEMFDFYKFCCDTYKKIDPSFATNLNSVAVMMNMAIGRYEEGFKILNEIVKKIKPAVYYGGGYSYQMRYSGPGMHYGPSTPSKNSVMLSQVNMDSFPPRFIPNTMQYYSYEQFQQIIKAKGFDKEKFIKAMATLSDPMARLAILSLISKEDTTKYAKALADNPKASLKDIQAAAYWFAYTRDNDAAAALFKILFEKSKNESERQYTLASLAVLVISRNPDKQYRKYVIANLDKLKPDVQNPYERERAVQLYRQLGQTKLAEKYAPKPMVASSSRSPHRIHAQPAYVNTNDVNRLVNERKYKEAAAILAKNFRRNFPKGVTNMSNNIWMLQDVTRNVQQYKLEDEFLKQLDPKADTTIQRLREYATANELLGKNDKAAELYEKLLKRRPRDDQANFFLAGYYIGKDSNKAMAFLKKFAVTGDMNLVSQKIQEAFNRNSDITYRIGMMKLTAELLKSVRDPNNTWFISNVLSNSDRVNYKGKDFYGITNNENSVDTFKKDVPEELRKEYMDALMQLCDANAEVSGNAESFMMKQRVLHFYGGDEKQLVAMAKKMMTNNINNPIYNVYGARSRRRRSSNQFTGDNPCVYILKRALTSGNWSDYDEVVAEISKSKVPQMVSLAKQYERLKEIYHADEKSSQKKLDALVDSIDFRNGMEFQILTLIAFTADDAGRKIELTPAILKLLKKGNDQPANYSVHSMYPLVQNWMVMLAMQDRTDEVIQLLKGMEKIFMSPEDIANFNETAATDPNFSLQNTANGRPNQGIQFYANIIQQLPYSVPDEDSRSGMMGTVLVFASDRPYLMDRNFKQQLHNYAQQAMRKYESLETIGMLKDLDTYCNVDRCRISEIILSCAAREFHNNNSQLLQTRQRIEKLEPQTFGSMVMLCAMQPDGEIRKKLLETYGAKIQALPKVQKIALARLMLAANVLSDTSVKLSPEAKTAYDDLRTMAKKELVDSVKSHLAMGPANDVYRYQNDTVELLNRCLSIAPEQFDELFSKSVENIVNSPNYRGSQPIDQVRRNVISQMSSMLISSTRERIASWQALFNGVAQNAKNSAVSSQLLRELMNNASSVFQNEYYRLRGNNDSQENRLAAAKKLLTQVDAQFGALGPVLGVVTIGNIIGGNWGGTEMDTWLAEKAKETSNDRWRDYGIMFENDWNRRQQKNAVLVAKMLGDESISPYTRIAMANHCLQNMEQRYGKPCALPLAKLVVKQGDPAMISWQVGYVADGDELDKNPELAKQLNALFRKRYDQNKNMYASQLRGSLEMRYGIFAKIACQAGDFEFAKELLKSPAFSFEYNNNPRYLIDMVDANVLLSRYPQMHEFLIASLKERKGVLEDRNISMASLITVQDLKAFVDMLDKSGAEDKFINTKMQVFSALRSYGNNNETRNFIESQISAMRSRYASPEKLTVPELIDAAYYFRNDGNDELNGLFVETVPFDKVFDRPEYNNRADHYSNLICNYFRKYLMQEEDADKVLKVVDKATAGSYRNNARLVNNMGGTLRDVCAQFNGYESRFRYPPEFYASLMEKILPKIKNDNYTSGRMAQSMFIIYYLVGDEKNAKKMIAILDRMDPRNSGYSPAQDVPAIYTNILGYEGRRNEKVFFDRLASMPNFYSFPSYYSRRNRSGSFEQDMVRQLMSQVATRQVGLKLSEKILPKLLEEFAKNPDTQNFDSLYWYYQNLRDNNKMQAFLDAAVKKNPGEQFFYSRAIEYFRNRRDDAKAIAYAELGMKNLKNPDIMYYSVADTYYYRGLHEQSADYIMKHYNGIVERGMQFNWLNVAADRYADAGNFDKAIAACKTLLELQQKNNKWQINEQTLKDKIAAFEARKAGKTDKKKPSRRSRRTGTIVLPATGLPAVTPVPTSRPVRRVRTIHIPMSVPATSQPASLGVPGAPTTQRAAG